VIIVVPSVPHSGTHFLKDHLLHGLETWVRHPYPVEQPKIIELLDAGNPAIVPWRDPDAVRASWLRRGKDPNNYAGWSLTRWYEEQAKLLRPYIDIGDIAILNIDNPEVRDDQLERINYQLGLELKTDWPVIRRRVDAKIHRERQEA
jgi:hypothetical protein